MNKLTKHIVQYSIFGMLALFTLYLSLYIKEFGAGMGWFSSKTLGGDGMVLWVCLMMSLSVIVTKFFRKIFGKQHSIFKV